MENNQNHIEDIFRDAFANHEMEVSSKVWAGVQSGIAAQGAAGTAAISTVMFKAAAVIGLTSVVAIGTVNEIKLQSDIAPQNEVLVIENEATETYNEAAQVEANDWVALEETQVVITPIENESTTKIVDAEEITHDANFAEEVSDQGDVASNEVENAASSKEPKPEGDQSSKAKNSSDDSEPKNKIEKSKQEEKTPQPKAREEAPVDTPQNLEEEKEEEEEKVCSIDFAHQAMGYISPDGDGANECFRLEDATQAQSFQITIFTREGVQVFQSRDPNFSWCGTDNFGNVLPNRTMCYYHIQASDENDIPYTKKNAKGSIQIFR